MYPHILQLLFLMAMGPQDPAAEAKSGPPLRVASEQFAFQNTADGVESIAVLGGDGEILRRIPLGDRLGRVGPGGLIGLMDRDKFVDHRDVQIVDAQGQQREQFQIAAKHEICLGERVLAVIPRGMCVPGTAYSIEFRAMNGTVLASHQREKLRLWELQRHSGDHWIAISRDASGRHGVQHYGPQGQLVWEFDTGVVGSPPIVALSSSGARASVGIIEGEGRLSRHYLLGADGSVTNETQRPAFRLAAFSPDEQRVVLAGQDSLQLVGVPDGATVWQIRRDWEFAPGQSVQFSEDGARVLISSLKAGAGPQREVIVQAVTADTKKPENSVVRLGSAKVGGVTDVRELIEKGAGKMVLVTGSAVISIDTQEGR